MNFTIGADPELFLKQGKKFVSAARILPGTKYEPEIMKCGAGLSWDNVACEFATIISGSENEFVGAIAKPLNEIKRKLNKYNLCNVSHAVFPARQTNREEELLFGCEPDFDAWKLVQNTPPRLPVKTFRTCGGHIHIGYVKGAPKELLSPEGKLVVVKLLDIFLGVPSVILDKKSKKRRSLYGKAGCHRQTRYGVEYRVLSNFWIFNGKTVRLIYKLVRDALNNIKDTELLIELCGGKNKIITCINKSDVKLANYIFKQAVYPRIKKDTKVLWEEPR